MRSGVAGLLHDKTRRSRIPPLSASAHERNMSLTLGDPPGGATHSTAEMMAKAAGGYGGHTDYSISARPSRTSATAFLATAWLCFALTTS